MVTDIIVPFQIQDKNFQQFNLQDFLYIFEDIHY